MFRRVNAFLEAIDKKSEEIADAADEEDITRAIQRHHAQEHDEHLRSSTSRISSGPSSTTGASAALHHNRSPAPPALTTASIGGASALSPSPSLRVPANVHGVATLRDPYASTTALRAAPLSLPTKLPSFRAPPTDAAGDTVERAASRRAALNHGLRSGGSGGEHTTDSAADPADTIAHLTTSTTTTAATQSWGDAHAAASSAAAIERLQAKCTALAAEKTRWQQEAATHRAQCGAARDSLWKAEQEVRASRAAQRDAEQALAVYKETAQRLLEEAQQEVRRAQAQSRSSSTIVNSSVTDDATVQRQQELAEAREMRQRLELLQAEHTALLSEVDRYQTEAAKAATELQQIQRTCRGAESNVDALRLEVHATQESLAGEVAAHADTKAALREVLAQRGSRTLGTTEGAGPTNEDAAAAGGSGGDVAQLQRELRDARQRHQLLLLQASNRQTALDAAEREVADMKARYNDLARQFDDAQVEVDAGFRAAGGYPAVTFGGGGVQRPRGGGSGAAADTMEHGVGGGLILDKSSTSSSTAAAVLLSGAGNPDALRRSPLMLQLARRYGAVGRAAVSVLAAVDAAALRLGRVLTQARWVWRVILMGYVGLLQVSVVLMVLASLASDD